MLQYVWLISEDDNTEVHGRTESWLTTAAEYYQHYTPWERRCGVPSRVFKGLVWSKQFTFLSGAVHVSVGSRIRAGKIF